MIPKYLKGKSAIEICNDMRYRAFRNHTIETPSVENYLIQLEMLLLLAVKDALMNADNKMDMEARGAEGRAIAFLNQVLPYENKT